MIPTVQRLKLAATLAAFLVAAPALAETPPPLPDDLRQAPSGTYELNLARSLISWEVGHMLSGGDAGEFKQAEGTLQFNGKEPEASSLDIVIQVGSLSTGMTSFDEMLRGVDYMNAVTFPQMRFRSRSIVRNGPRTGQMTGDLDFRGVTRPVTLDVVWDGIGSQPETGRPLMDFSATGTLRRSEFGFGYGVPMVNDEVRLTIRAQMVRRP